MRRYDEMKRSVGNKERKFCEKCYTEQKFGAESFFLLDCVFFIKTKKKNMEV
jgi:hypothetical protein